jgi:hypothetical protein
MRLFGLPSFFTLPVVLRHYCRGHGTRLAKQSWYQANDYECCHCQRENFNSWHIYPQLNQIRRYQRTHSHTTAWLQNHLSNRVLDSVKGIAKKEHRNYLTRQTFATQPAPPKTLSQYCRWCCIQSSRSSVAIILVNCIYGIWTGQRMTLYTSLAQSTIRVLSTYCFQPCWQASTVKSIPTTTTTLS